MNASKKLSFKQLKFAWTFILCSSTIMILTDIAEAQLRIEPELSLGTPVGDWEQKVKTNQNRQLITSSGNLNYGLHLGFAYSLPPSLKISLRFTYSILQRDTGPNFLDPSSLFLFSLPFTCYPSTINPFFLEAGPKAGFVLFDNFSKGSDTLGVFRDGYFAAGAEVALGYSTDWFKFGLRTSILSGETTSPLLTEFFFGLILN